MRPLLPQKMKNIFIVLFAVLIYHKPLFCETVAVSGMVYPTGILAQVNNGGGWNASDITMDSAGDRIGWVFQAPETGDITDLSLVAYTTSSTFTIIVGLYTVDSLRQPTATLYGGSSTGTVASFTDTTSLIYYSSTLGTPASAVKGDLIAMVVSFSTYTTGSTHIDTFTGTGSAFRRGMPSVMFYDGAAWSDTLSHLSGFGIEYDGTFHYIPGSVVQGASPYLFHDSYSNGTEQGMKFVPEFSMTVRGMVWAGDTYSDFTAKLYDSDNNVLTSMAVPDGPGSNTDNTNEIIFPTEVELTAGETYRVTVLNSGISVLRIWQFTTGSAARAQTASTACEMTSRSGGAWTDAPTILPSVALILSEIDIGSSGGSAYSYGSAQ